MFSRESKFKRVGKLNPSQKFKVLLNQMTNQHWTKPVKDVSISRLAGQRFSHHSTDICVSLTMRAIYTFITSSLIDPVFP